MITRKVAWTILAILLVGLAIFLLAPSEDAEAQTAPAWVFTTLSSTSGTSGGGLHPVYKTAAGDRSLSMVQIDEAVSLECTGWGRDISGTWVRVFPAPGDGVTADVTSDTTLTIVSGSNFFRFTNTRLEVLIVHAGTADSAWGE